MFDRRFLIAGVVGALILVAIAAIVSGVYVVGSAAQRTTIFRDCTTLGAWRDVDGTIYDCSFKARK